MEQIESEYILKAYEYWGNIRRAAQKLGMTHSTFANKLNRYKTDRAEF
jgi:TyrR family helix-turn-helix protein